jgi:hypothetical protein
MLQGNMLGEGLKLNVHPEVTVVEVKENAGPHKNCSESEQVNKKKRYNVNHLLQLPMWKTQLP